MSGEAARHVRRHSPVTGVAKRVLVELALAAGDGGHGAQRSVRRLAGDAGAHRNTVLRALRELERDDRIRRHTGGPDHCAACARCRRDEVVYDVVIPPGPVTVADGQMTLLAAASSGTPNWHNDVPDVVPVAKRNWHRHGDRSVTVAVTERIKDKNHHHHLEGAREKSSELADTAADVIRILGLVSKPGWFVDEIAVEALVMTWASHRDPRRAAAAVVASAMGHVHVNAAKLLAKALEWQRPDAPRPGSYPRPAAAAPDGFSKYDVAMGLA